MFTYSQAKFITYSQARNLDPVQIVTLKKSTCQPRTVNYSFPVCVYGSRKWEIHPPPCLKGRKQSERREDVSDLAEGSPGLTLKPRRLSGWPSGEDERSSATVAKAKSVRERSRTNVEMQTEGEYTRLREGYLDNDLYGKGFWLRAKQNL